MQDVLSERLLVTGASEHLGRKIIEELLKRGAEDIVGTTRDPSKLGDLAARGVEIRKADFDQPETLVPAFEGVTRLVLVSTDAVHQPGLRIRQHHAAIAAAAGRGVRYLVYLVAQSSSDSRKLHPG